MPETRSVVHYSIARQARITLHGSIYSMEAYVCEMACKRLNIYHTKLSLRRNGTNLWPPRLEDSFDGLDSNPKRFMGDVRAPFFNGQTVDLDWGFHCLACKAHHYGRPLHWRRKYTTDTFQDDLRKCGKIIEGERVPLVSRVKDSEV